MTDKDRTVRVLYTNWRGETSVRRIVPNGVPFFGATAHHPEEQWLIRVWDCDKQAYRTFAMKDMDFVNVDKVADVMQALYDSEINVCVQSFFDAGFTVRIGDDMNGYKASDEVKTWDEALVWLKKAALHLYPNSVFAKRMNPN